MKIKTKNKTTYITLNSKKELQDLKKLIKMIGKEQTEKYFVMGDYEGIQLCLRYIEENTKGGYRLVAGNVVKQSD